MTSFTTLGPISVETGSPDQDGLLVLADGKLVAVLVRLSEQHGEQAGQWYLEAGFGPLNVQFPPSFVDIDAAQNWISRRLALRAAAEPAG